MTTHITKTWFEDGKLITQFFEEKDIYKREWVGLTDGEAQWLYDNCRTPSNLIDMVEAKLKEKNT